MPVGRAVGRAVDLVGVVSAEQGLGVIWTQEESTDLNANLVRFEAGEGVGIHANYEGDVLFVGVSGSGTVEVDGEKFVLEPGRMVFVPRGSLRATRSSSGEFAYLAVHRRRGPLRLASRARRGDWADDTAQHNTIEARSTE